MKQTIGQFLATLRKARGLTQEEVADKLNVSNKTLSSWETDRTTPDALTLPAIADLYDVSVDEILRGEKQTLKGDNKPQITETAKLSLTKKSYGKFSVKRFTFTAFGLLSILLNILGFAFLVYTSVETWIGITLSVIGFCGTVTLSILLIYFERTTLLSEGIFDNENQNDDFTQQLKEKSNALALCLKHKNSVSLISFSLPYLIFAIITLIYLIAAGGTYTVSAAGVSLKIDRTSVFIGFICTSFVIGLVYLVLGTTHGLRAMKAFGSQSQQATHKQNKKLFGILSGVCAGVFTLFFVVSVVFSLITVDILRTEWIEYVEETKVHTKNFEEFKELSQTLILDDKTVAEYGLPKNRFVLQLPENWKDGDEQNLTDLGNGFYGRINYDYTDLRPYEILYKHMVKDEETGEECPVYTAVGAGTIVKVYHDRKHTDFDYVLYLPTSVQENHIQYRTPDGEEIFYNYSLFLIYYSCGDYVGKNFSTGEYGLFHSESYHVEKLAWFCCGIITCVTIIVCISVYLAKRKKQVYKI